MKAAIKNTIASFICFTSLTNNAAAQEFDLFDPQFSLVHIVSLHAIYAGVARSALGDPKI